AARNAFQKFQAAQATPARLDRDVFQFRARAAAQTPAVNFNFAKIRVRETNDDTAKTAVAHEQIRAAANKEKWHAARAAKFQDGGQIRLRRRLDINIRRAADAQGRVLGERFVAADNRR